MKNCTLVFALLATLGLALFAGTADAGLITVAEATASSYIPESDTPQPNRGPANLIDGSGLSGGLQSSSNFRPDMWLSDNNDTAGWVQFDLGAVYTVSSFEVWNYYEGWSGSEQRSVNDVTIVYGSTTANMAAGTIDGSSTVPDVTSFTIASATNPYAGTTYTPASSFDARYVQFDISSTHGATFAGMAEVQFDGVPAGPPPAEPTIVSVNLDKQSDSDPDENTDRIPAASSIGVINAANWNNVRINNPNPSAGGPYTGLVDSDNSPVAGLSFSITGGGADSWNTGGHIPARMMGDWVNNLTGLEITDIPENDGVTLITYHGGFNKGDDTPPENTVNVTANGVLKTYEDWPWDNQQFDNAGAWAYTEGENYLRWDFAGPTDSISLTFENVNAFHRALNGFQLSITPVSAAVPEPSTFVLAALGLLGLSVVARRRRKRT